MTVPKGRYQGAPADHVPDEENRHTMLCPACGKPFDMRDLGEVLEHYHYGPPVRFGRRRTVAASWQFTPPRHKKRIDG